MAMGKSKIIKVVGKIKATKGKTNLTGAFKANSSAR
jgi:hypothetical protein